jgi:hypothetical protein
MLSNGIVKGVKELNIIQLFYVHIFPTIGFITSFMGKQWRMAHWRFGTKKT